LNFVVDLLDRGITSWLGVDLKELINSLKYKFGSRIIDNIKKAGGEKYLNESYYVNENGIKKIDRALKGELKKELKHVKKYIKGIKNPKVNLDKFKRQTDKNVMKELNFVVDLLDRGMTSWMGIDLKQLLNAFANKFGKEMKEKIKQAGGEEYLNEGIGNMLKKKKELNDLEKELNLAIDLLDKGNYKILNIDIKNVLNKLVKKHGDKIRNFIEKKGGKKYLDEEYYYDDLNEGTSLILLDLLEKYINKMIRQLKNGQGDKYEIIKELNHIAQKYGKRWKDFIIDAGGEAYLN